MVSEIEGEDKDAILSYAAYAEYYSNHPLALSIKNAYQKPIDKERIKDISEIAGKGIKLILDNDTILVGNAKLLDLFNVNYTPSAAIGTLIYVVKNDKFLGTIVINDEIKPEAKDLIKGLTELNITDTIMLSGDNKQIAAKVASTIGIKDYKAQLLPQDKVTAIDELLANKDAGVLAYCGDGINDAPVLMRADVGIAMGALGSDAAIEASDVILMDDNIKKIPTAIKLSRSTMQIVYQNIIFAILIKVIVLILGALGYAGMWLAIFADVGVACLCILNAMRTLYVKKYQKELEA